MDDSQKKRRREEDFCAETFSVISVTGDDQVPPSNIGCSLCPPPHSSLPPMHGSIIPTSSDTSPVAFFATRSRVLKVCASGVRRIARLTLYISYIIYQPWRTSSLITYNFTATLAKLLTTVRVRLPFPYQCGSCDVTIHHTKMLSGPSSALMKRYVIAPSLLSNPETMRSLIGFPFMGSRLSRVRATLLQIISRTQELFHAVRGSSLC